MEDRKKLTAFMLILTMCLGLAAVSVSADNIIYTTDPSYSYCINTTHSSSQWTYWDDTETPELWDTHTKNSTCSLGCNSKTGTCNAYPTGFEILFLPILALIFFYFSTTLKEGDWAIQMLLISSALFILIVSVSTAELALQATPIFPIYLLVITVTIIVIFYYFIKIIVRIHDMMVGK